MRVRNTLALGIAALVLFGGVTTGLAIAGSHKLVLTVGGKAVPAGTALAGEVRFGPCGTLTSTGTLKGNDRRVDEPLFTSFENAPGGCGEGGPTIGGELKSLQVTARGQFAVEGNITYKVQLPKSCEYALAQLTGTFSLPGATEAELSGVGTRLKGSEHGCANTLPVSKVKATLYDSATKGPFEAEDP